MDVQIMQAIVLLANRIDPIKVGVFLATYATDKLEATALDVAMRPIARLINQRFHFWTDDGARGSTDEFAAEVERMVNFATCLEDRISRLEAKQAMTEAELIRRLRAPSVALLIQHSAESATETGEQSTAVILAELVASRLQHEEDSIGARSIQRAVAIASDLTLAELLLVGGIALVTVPDAIEPTYRNFANTGDTELYRAMYDDALPKLFVHPPVQIELMDLQSLGVVIERIRETPGMPMQLRTPIENVITRVRGDSQRDTTGTSGQEYWMRPGSSLHRAARLAVPSDDGVSIADHSPVLSNYALTTHGWRLAEAVLRGSINADVTIADQLRL